MPVNSPAIKTRIKLHGQVFELVRSSSSPVRSHANWACLGCVAFHSPQLCQELPPSCITQKSIWIAKP